MSFRSKLQTHGKTFLSLSAGFVQFSCFIHLFNSKVLEISQCAGPSMLPTFNTWGDFLLVKKILSHHNDQLKIGDLVIITSPYDASVVACKRVIAKEGDEICRDPSQNDYTLGKVPQGHIWVQGDNASNSTDSRTYGPVPNGLIKGKVLFRLFPQFKSFTDENSVKPITANSVIE
ncbi:LexA/Signal peptidase [Conidiobolus coronatus NRRL 28638]|uniref:LexA/Signal peptidase n=1 Tax=Conidiobolus coronatus (strain ATCC 28846 / CBS 209.66 / NRRL 28638) TaxID=796925 RepID=A0A137P9K9_CONC2|nr:LexA/Signal peptidase [Conidiobolus coronatus NRRL 28638]|eukprot:KXN71698.1 LexA/Signal peptidase [Conidiobolus coronatus NRRL 28638]